MWRASSGVNNLESCRTLCKIGLTLDARDVPVEAYADVCSPSITYPITFHNSPLKHPDLVAEFLSKHLPSMLVCFHRLFGARR